MIEVVYWDPYNWLVTYLGVMHQKGELLVHNKFNWVLGLGENKAQRHIHGSQENQI